MANLDKVEFLVQMGIPKNEADLAITRCGKDASISDLVNSICDSQTRGDGYCCNLFDVEDNSYGGRNKGRSMDGNRTRREKYGGQARGSRCPLDGSFDEPGQCSRPVDRSLHPDAIGPPYFYYENVARAPKGVWNTISRELYGIEPEFVDTKDFCATTRKRGYIHNLPVENRLPLLPIPPKTIQEAFPHTKRWWPSWDPRKQFNTLQTRYSGAILLGKIHEALGDSSAPPPEIRKFVLEKCRKWNLIWVGLNKVAYLEPDEMEFLLGFPKDHSRGFSSKERYQSLGSAFQVDTVAYHLSVLKDMYPQGIKVLSLFSGIGRAEVALHRLGIHMKTVDSVEKSGVRRSILRSWWSQTQTGTLIQIGDVQSDQLIEAHVRTIGGFDLVIGASPWNHLANKGLEGELSSLFYHYPRILKFVKSIMKQ